VLLHISAGVSVVLSFGVGLTVIVNVFVGPEQLLPPYMNVGVTTIVATRGAVPVLVAVKDAILPVPVAGNPMPVAVFVHEYVVVPTVLTVLNVTAVVAVPLHNTWLAGWSTWPVGLTVIVKVSSGPVQLTPPFVNVGVTTIVATTGAVPALIAVNEAILPVPVAGNPMPVVVFVHEYVVVPPVLVVAKLTAAVPVLLQTTWLAGWVTCAVGLTVIVNDFEGPVQLLPLYVKVGVTTIVATTGAVPALVAVNDAILPVPVAGNPMPVAVFVHEYVVVPTVLVVVKLTAVVPVPLQTTWLPG